MAGAEERTEESTGTAVFLPAHALHRHPNFRRYRLARTVSLAGSMVTYVVLPILAYQITGSAMWTATVTVVQSLPYLCFGLLAGSVADRMRRPRHAAIDPPTPRAVDRPAPPTVDPSGLSAVDWLGSSTVDPSGLSAVDWLGQGAVAPSGPVGVDSSGQVGVDLPDQFGVDRTDQFGVDRSDLPGGAHGRADQAQPRDRRAQPEPVFGGGEHAPSSSVRAQPEPGFGGGGHAPSSSVRAQLEPGFGGGGHAPSSPGERDRLGGPDRSGRHSRPDWYSWLDAVGQLVLGRIGRLARHGWARHLVGDRRRLAVVADLGNAALLASVPIAYTFDGLTAPHLLFAALGGQALFVLFDAASSGARPFRAGWARGVAEGGAVLELYAPVLAGALLAVTAAAPLLTVDAVSVVVSALLIRAISAPLRSALPRIPQPRLRADIRAGLAMLYRQPVVRAQTVAVGLQAAAGGAVLGQLAPWLDQVLGVRPQGDGRLGLLLAAWGAGAVVAGTVYPRLVRRLGEHRVALFSLPASALCGLVCVLATHWLVAAFALVAWGVTGVVGFLDSVALSQRIGPDRMRGRVEAASRMLSFGVGWPVGALAGGVVSALSGPRAAITAGVVLVAAGALVAWLSPLRTAGPAPLLAGTD